ncbi:hypothetical protein JT05_03155 [Desulfosporosinus sp. Tol-M]|jgi:putative methyltransferase, YaeB/AF_0241 family|nr:hypothetical protein JT05_03155 [Desulfosporosinus sp. Tol-M]
MEDIVLKPVGEVRTTEHTLSTMPLWGEELSIIEIYPEYAPALLKIQEHSHFWILSWFNQADRSVLRKRPERVNPDLPEYGVFGIRTPFRPNPIGLTLVKLEKVEENRLYVAGLDALDGTPIIDIKPYFEQDIIFSPKAPYISPGKRERKYPLLMKEAINQHQEDCADLHIGIHMALIAEEYFGKLNSDDLRVAVTGPLCLGDVLQGLTRARLANPPRFSITSSDSVSSSVWYKGGKTLTIKQRKPEIEVEDARNISDDELFIVVFLG